MVMPAMLGIPIFAVAGSKICRSVIGGKFVLLYGFLLKAVGMPGVVQAMACASVVSRFSNPLAV